MSSPEEIWRDFGSDENRVSVRSDNKARVYFSQIRRALAGLKNSVEDGASITNAERLAVIGDVLNLAERRVQGNA